MKLRNLTFFIVDLVATPFTIVAALWLKLIRKYIVKFFYSESPISKKIFQTIGVFPIIDHYYEPFFGNPKYLKKSLRDNRILPGINFNKQAQLQLLQEFNYNQEIIEISNKKKSELTYSFCNDAFSTGDAEILFNMVRLLKPKRIIEIGCGHSSLMIQHAMQYNKSENAGYICEHICIEPYEQPWLEKLDVTVIRKKVEEIDNSIYLQLEANDILFIDSSHIIRPQGDVLYEYLQILPTLNKGVMVHIHDIFSPKDYLEEWFTNGLVFWNEQYLLEAFLSCNNQFSVILALNFLKHNCYAELSAKCPLIDEKREPGSFWIQRV